MRNGTAAWEAFQATYNSEWPVMRRGKAEAARHEGKWWIWVDAQPVALGETNSAAWLDYEQKRAVRP